MCPIFCKTPWFTVYSYGLMIALGYTLTTWWIIKEAKNEGLDHEAVFDMMILQLIVGVMGSRFLYLIEYAPQRLSLHTFLNFKEGGLTFYGAVLSSFIFDILFLKLKNVPILKGLDCLGFSVPLGIMLGRIGCFLNGCCYGVKCSLPWGVVFPRVGPYPVHPTQIYESLSGLLIFIMLQKYKAYRKNYGEVFLIFIGSYAFIRFIIEFFRADNPVEMWGMTLSQLIGIVVFILAVIGYFYLNFKTNKYKINKTSVNRKLADKEAW